MGAVFLLAQALLFWWGLFRVPAGATANRVALFRRGNQEGGLGGFCQFWFWWVDALLVVFRRAKNSRLLLRLRLTSAYRRRFACRLGALTCFLTPSLIARSWRGTGVHPREDNPAVLVSLRLPIPSGISSRGLHAPGVSPPGCPVGFGV